MDCRKPGTLIRIGAQNPPEIKPEQLSRRRGADATYNPSVMAFFYGPPFSYGGNGSSVRFPLPLSSPPSAIKMKVMYLLLMLPLRNLCFPLRQNERKGMITNVGRTKAVLYFGLQPQPPSVRPPSNRFTVACLSVAISFRPRGNCRRYRLVPRSVVDFWKF